MSDRMPLRTAASSCRRHDRDRKDRRVSVAINAATGSTSMFPSTMRMLTSRDRPEEQGHRKIFPPRVSAVCRINALGLQNYGIPGDRFGRFNVSLSSQRCWTSQRPGTPGPGKRASSASETNDEANPPGAKCWRDWPRSAPPP
jgi:hypothetical protein